MDKAAVETALLRAGVKNLRTFGYPHVDEQNIMTDEVYAAFFRSMLKDSKGTSAVVDHVVDALIQRIDDKAS